MPTPRPETLVTFSAVEKPGRKIRLMVSCSERTASGATSLRSMALARMAARLRPRPSSLMVTMTLEPSWAAERWMVPCRGLPARSRSAGS